LSRRELFKLAGLTAAGFSLGDELAARSQAAEPVATPAAELPPLNRFPRMVQEYFVERVRAVERLATSAAPRSIRKKTRRRTSARCARKSSSASARAGKIVAERPDDRRRRARRLLDRKSDFREPANFPVTANLYLPKGRTGPAPGVVGTCGHSKGGKAEGPYQSFAQGLARQGYVCLIFDPIGQGERSQYLTSDLKPRHGGPVGEHLYAGNQQFLVGDFFGAWRAWDGIRALDYLLTRPRSTRGTFGVTGNSAAAHDDVALWCGAALDHGGAELLRDDLRRNLENEFPPTPSSARPARSPLASTTPISSRRWRRSP